MISPTPSPDHVELNLELNLPDSPVVALPETTTERMGGIFQFFFGKRSTDDATSDEERVDYVKIGAGSVNSGEIRFRCKSVNVHVSTNARDGGTNQSGSPVDKIFHLDWYSGRMSEYTPHR